MPSPGERVAVSESMNRDLNTVSVWCNLWGMKLNASKTKTMIVSRSRTVHPQVTPLTPHGTVLKESADHVILVVTFDAKTTFEKRLRSVSSAAAQRLCIVRKSWQVFHDRSLLQRSFWSFVLPVLEYCSAVWCSAADSHPKLLDRSAGCQECWFSSWWCFREQPCPSSICSRVVHAIKGKVVYGQEPPSGESTTTECGFNYELLAVITEVAQWGAPSCSQPQPAADNGVRDGRSN